MHILPAITTKHFGIQKQTSKAFDTTRHYCIKYKKQLLDDTVSFGSNRKSTNRAHFPDDNDLILLNYILHAPQLLNSDKENCLAALFRSYGYDDEKMHKILFFGINSTPEASTNFAIQYFKAIDTCFRGDEYRREELLEMALFSRNERKQSVIENSWNTNEYLELMGTIHGCLEDFPDLKSRFLYKTNKELKNIKRLQQLAKLIKTEHVDLHKYKKIFTGLNPDEMAYLCLNSQPKETLPTSENIYNSSSLDTYRCLNAFCTKDNIAALHNIPDTKGRYISTILTHPGDIEDLNEALEDYPAILYSVLMHKDNEGRLFKDFFIEALQDMDKDQNADAVEALNKGLYALCCTKNGVPTRGQKALLDEYSVFLNPLMKDIQNCIN